MPCLWETDITNSFIYLQCKEHEVKSNKCQIRQVRRLVNTLGCQCKGVEVTSLCCFICPTWRLLGAENSIAGLHAYFSLECLCLGIFFPFKLTGEKLLLFSYIKLSIVPQKLSLIAVN